MVAQTQDTVIGEYAENVTLMIVELVWCFATESRELFVEKSLDTCQREVRETTTVVEQIGDALQDVSTHPWTSQQYGDLRGP